MVSEKIQMIVYIYIYILTSVSFYPSISEELLDKALVFAKLHTTVTPDEEDIIQSCRKSVLFNDGKVWTKKDKDFDVTMGAQDGAEIAELVGFFYSSKLIAF